MTSLLVSNALTSSISKLFHPIVYAVAWSLAYIYGLIPNYGIAIAILTVIIMGLLTPLTVKSTRSMVAMQRIQPELKKLQQKYKGPEHRTELNEEMMRLYKEQGVNPATGCITGLLQAPFLFILYSIIRGLANVNTVGKRTFAAPKDIPHSSKMYANLIASGGKMVTWGMNIALKPFSPHGSVVDAIPFFVFVAAAVGLQYFQMSQLNRRNQNRSQMSSQMLMFQRLTPILFAYIYFIVPAAAVIYMIVSSIIRILTQDLVFRFDSKSKARAGSERAIPAARTDADDAEDTAGPATTKPSTTASNGAAAIASGSTTPRASSVPKPPAHPRSKAKKKRKAR